ncbi:MAG: mnmE 1 [Firmicutes bacterium]|nr:mnmE 1 [Bacillota bacterium]
MVQEDTISAIATAVGDGGIGIIRISGIEAVHVADTLFRSVRNSRVSEITSHVATFGHIYDPVSKEIVDEVLLLVMRAPRSYTREDVVEIHCHGGALPLKRVLDLTIRAGARMAQPGEFTKRAFLNGRMDLSQAEAVIDIIRSKTEASLKMSVGHLTGVFSGKISAVRQELLRLIAHLEAAIDFPEDDIEAIASADVADSVTLLIQEITNILGTAQAGRILRDGLKTVIIGKPNVGKSSLLNALLREKRAIVTDIPGTTRDIIEEYCNIDGVPLRIIDTAGIRETSDIVEKMGVEKAWEMLEQADVALLILDASMPLTQDDREIIDLIQKRKCIVLINKSDLTEVLEVKEVRDKLPDKPVISISVLHGIGLEQVSQAIKDLVYSGQVSQGEAAFVNNIRHVDILEKTKSSLEEVMKTISNAMPPDCIVIDLRAAWQKLGEITGETVNEDIIDQIFSQFCIGK